MKKLFKQCPRCGYVHISKQEKAIFDMMPTTSEEVSEKLKMSKNHAATVMGRLVKLGILIMSARVDRYITYSKSDDAYDLMNMGE
ncbi:MAG: hypothetical protein ACFE95_13405 [Candidatus Hodarchaeota archaeon]